MQIELAAAIRRGRMAEHLRAVVHGRLAETLGAHLARRLDEALTSMTTSPHKALQSAVAEAETAARAAVERLPTELGHALDRLCVAGDLATGDAFGTTGYESGLAALEHDEARQDPPAVDALEREARQVESRLAETVALDLPTRPWLVAAFIGMAAATGLIVLTGPSLDPWTIPGAIAAGRAQWLAPRLAAIAFTSALWALLPSLLRRWRRRRIDRAQRALAATLHRSIDARVEAWTTEALQAVVAWLDGELRARIANRRRERALFQRAYRQDLAAVAARIRLRPAYAGRAAGLPYPSARLPLEGCEWDALALRVAPAEPSELLATFCRQASDDPVQAAALVRASAAQVRLRCRAWVRARVAEAVAREGGLALALAVLPEPERRRRIRSIAGAGVPSVRLGRDGGLDHLAVLPGDLDAALPLRSLIAGTVPVDDFVDVPLPDRVDLVALHRGRFGAADVAAALGAGRLAGRTDAIRRHLPTAELERLDRQHGLIESMLERASSPHATSRSVLRVSSVEPEPAGLDRVPAISGTPLGQQADGR